MRSQKGKRPDSEEKENHGNSQVASGSDEGEVTDKMDVVSSTKQQDVPVKEEEQNQPMECEEPVKEMEVQDKEMDVGVEQNFNNVDNTDNVSDCGSVKLSEHTSEMPDLQRKEEHGGGKEPLKEVYHSLSSPSPPRLDQEEVETDNLEMVKDGVEEPEVPRTEVIQECKIATPPSVDSEESSDDEEDDNDSTASSSSSEDESEKEVESLDELTVQGMSSVKKSDDIKENEVECESLIEEEGIGDDKCLPDHTDESTETVPVVESGVRELESEPKVPSVSSPVTRENSPASSSESESSGSESSGESSDDRDDADDKDEKISDKNTDIEVEQMPINNSISTHDLSSENSEGFLGHSTDGATEPKGISKPFDGDKAADVPDRSMQHTSVVSEIFSSSALPLSPQHRKICAAGEPDHFDNNPANSATVVEKKVAEALTKANPNLAQALSDQIANTSAPCTEKVNNAIPPIQPQTNNCTDQQRCKSDTNLNKQGVRNIPQSKHCKSSARSSVTKLIPAASAAMTNSTEHITNVNPQNSSNITAGNFSTVDLDCAQLGLESPASINGELNSSSVETTPSQGFSDCAQLQGNYCPTNTNMNSSPGGFMEAVNNQMTSPVNTQITSPGNSQNFNLPIPSPSNNSSTNANFSIPNPSPNNAANFNIPNPSPNSAASYNMAIPSPSAQNTNFNIPNPSPSGNSTASNFNIPNPSPGQASSNYSMPTPSPTNSSHSFSMATPSPTATANNYSMPTHPQPHPQQQQHTVPVQQPQPTPVAASTNTQNFNAPPLCSSAQATFVAMPQNTQRLTHNAPTGHNSCAVPGNVPTMRPQLLANFASGATNCSLSKLQQLTNGITGPEFIPENTMTPPPNLTPPPVNMTPPPGNVPRGMGTSPNLQQQALNYKYRNRTGSSSSTGGGGSGNSGTAPTVSVANQPVTHSQKAPNVTVNPNMGFPQNMAMQPGVNLMQSYNMLNGYRMQQPMNYPGYFANMTNAGFNQPHQIPMQMMHPQAAANFQQQMQQAQPNTQMYNTYAYINSGLPHQPFNVMRR